MFDNEKVTTKSVRLYLHSEFRRDAWQVVMSRICARGGALAANMPPPKAAALGEADTALRQRAALAASAVVVSRLECEADSATALARVVAALADIDSLALLTGKGIKSSS